MPSFPCKHTTCAEYVQQRGDYCEAHAIERQNQRTETRRYYDQHSRDPEAKRFYNSAAWKCARRIKLARDPVCERCRKKWAEHVHHCKPLAECTDAERLDQKLLKSLCQPCHNAEEAELRRAKAACCST